MHADNLLLFRRHIPARSEKWIYNGWGNSLHFSFTSAPTEIYGKCKMAYTDTLEFFLTFVIITLKRTQCMAPRLRQEVYIHYFTDWFRVHDFPSSCRRHQGAERNFKLTFLCLEWQQIRVNYWLCSKLSGLVPEVDPAP